MQAESARAVNFAGRLPAGFGQFRQKAVQRFLALGQAAGQGRPVVHFGVDVRRVVAAPRRVDTVVPNTLQVQRLAALARTRNHQIAAEVEHQQIQIFVFLTALVALQTLVRRHRGAFFTGVQSQANAVVQT